jgi:hypothetical protein
MISDLLLDAKREKVIKHSIKVFKNESWRVVRLIAVNDLKCALEAINEKVERRIYLPSTSRITSHIKISLNRNVELQNIIPNYNYINNPPHPPE